MSRRWFFFGAPAFLIILIAACLVRSCEKGPVVLPASPPLEPAIRPAARKAAPIGKIAPSKSVLLAPRLLNLDELQENIRKYYPEAEHRAGKEGHVGLSMVVGADGAVSRIAVETSGGADFDEAAKKAALAMRFSPARRAGAPVAVEISEGIDFQFDSKR